MTKLSTVVIAVSLCSFALAQGEELDPMVGIEYTNVPPPLEVIEVSSDYVTRDQLEGMYRQYEAEKSSADAANSPSVVKRHRRRASMLAIRISGLESKVANLEKANLGGPATPLMRFGVEAALERGPEHGGMVGRREDATPDDMEWQTSPTREELAVVADRNATYTESLMNAHNADVSAHPSLQATVAAAVAKEAAARKKLAKWLWAAIGIVLLVAIGGYFFPRIRREIDPGSEPEPEPEPE